MSRAIANVEPGDLLVRFALSTRDLWTHRLLRLVAWNGIGHELSLGSELAKRHVAGTVRYGGASDTHFDINELKATFGVRYNVFERLIWRRLAWIHSVLTGAVPVLTCGVLTRMRDVRVPSAGCTGGTDQKKDKGWMSHPPSTWTSAQSSLALASSLRGC